MDVKNTFLNRYVNEEVYVDQPLGFEDTSHLDHVFKLKKTPYGLKQAPRSQYDRLSIFLLNKRYLRGKVDQTLFIKKQDKYILVVQIYVDDIIFGSTKKNLCTEFFDIMKSEFEMSLIGELQFFLGLQVKQTSAGIFICQSKYTLEILKKFNIEKMKSMKIPMATNIMLDKDKFGKSVNATLY